jgi:hypothetical protein
VFSGWGGLSVIGERGSGEFLNAEGAKVTQRAQKGRENKYKFKNAFKNLILLLIPFGFLLSSSAFSA